MKGLNTTKLAGFLFVLMPLTYSYNSYAYDYNDDDPDTRTDSRYRHDEHSRSTSHDGSFYLGASYGYAKAEGGDFDDENDIFEVTAGGFFNRFIGIEASGTYFGRYRSEVASADSYGFGIALMGRLPLSDVWGIYAKGGQFFWETDVDTDLGSFDESGDDPFYAVGTDFDVTDNLNIIVEYSRYEIDNRVADIVADDSTDIDTVKVGLRLVF